MAEEKDKDGPKKQDDEAKPGSEDSNAREEIGDMVEKVETPGSTGL